ncbi:hypothetical protein KAW38_03890 [Candidatus Micrarchaeota archaeon]|nr:hypothetical protein [Candidatus Micrarchaeota archaeon]
MKKGFFSNLRKKLASLRKRNFIKRLHPNFQKRDPLLETGYNFLPGMALENENGKKNLYVNDLLRDFSSLLSECIPDFSFMIATGDDIQAYNKDLERIGRIKQKKGLLFFVIKADEIGFTEDSFAVFRFRQKLPREFSKIKIKNIAFEIHGEKVIIFAKNWIGMKKFECILISNPSFSINPQILHS